MHGLCQQSTVQMVQVNPAPHIHRLLSWTMNHGDRNELLGMTSRYFHDLRDGILT